MQTLEALNYGAFMTNKVFTIWDGLSTEAEQPPHHLENPERVFHLNFPICFDEKFIRCLPAY